MSNPWIIRFDFTPPKGKPSPSYYSSTVGMTVESIRMASRYDSFTAAAKALWRVQDSWSSEDRWTGRVVRLRLKGAR